MEVMGAGAADAQLAKLRASSAPRLLSRREADYLNGKNAIHAKERMNLEARLEDDLDAAIETVYGQIYKASELEAALRADVMAEQRGYGGGEVAGRGSGEPRYGLAGAAPNLLKHTNGRDKTEKPTPVACSETESRFREVAGRLIQLRGKLAALQAKARPLAARATACRKFLSQAIGGQSVMFSEPLIPVKGTQRQAQERIAELRVKLDEAKKAPVTTEFACRRAASWIKARSRPINALPLLNSMINEDAGPSEPYVAKESIGVGVETANALGVLFWLMEDELVKRLQDQIKGASRGDEERLDPDKQKERIKQIEGEILDAEFVDEAIAFRLLQEGKDVELRADADPRAILCARREGSK